MRNRTSGITLLELIISVILVFVALAALSNGYIFIYGRIVENIRLQNIHLQMDYALENIRLHCLSATSIESPFEPDIDSSKTSLIFEGESDIHNITPDNRTDNTIYTYEIDEDKNLVLKTGETAEQKEILIDAQYAPSIIFQYCRDTEPNFLTVTINTTDRQGNISKTEGLRFWFTDVVNTS